MTLSMLIETTNIVEQNIALERIQYFIATHIHGCLFIDETNKDAIAKYNAVRCSKGYYTQVQEQV